MFSQVTDMTLSQCWWESYLDSMQGVICLDLAACLYLALSPAEAL